MSDSAKEVSWKGVSDTPEKLGTQPGSSPSCERGQAVGGAGVVVDRGRAFGRQTLVRGETERNTLEGGALQYSTAPLVYQVPGAFQPFLSRHSSRGCRRTSRRRNMPVSLSAYCSLWTPSPLL